MADYRCSFCGKRQDQVKKLIAGPTPVFICDECVTLCKEIVDEEFSAAAAADETTVSGEPPAVEPQATAASRSGAASGSLKMAP